MTRHSLRDRFQGALLGLAAGDAVGTTVEFKDPGSFDPVTDMTGGGPFGLPLGAWTDDTSLALCLAESLIECQGFEPVDQLERYVRWYREGHLSSTGSCFDIGNSTSSSLHRFEQTGEPFPGLHFPNAAGNGALMRQAPVPLAFLLDPREAVRLAGESAQVTHGDQRAIDSSRYFAGLLLGALNGKPASSLLGSEPLEPYPSAWNDDPLHPEVEVVARGSFLEKEPPEIVGSGFVVKALEAALWALSNSDDFESGVLLAVNLGDDADTTAAIYGQLACALHGASGIPDKWLENLVMREKIIQFADGLLDLHLSAEITDSNEV